MIAAIVYPHQLFGEFHGDASEFAMSEPQWLNGISCVFLVEDPLFFRQYRFHRQKLLLHRASMMRYAEQLIRIWKKVTYDVAAKLNTV